MGSPSQWGRLPWQFQLLLRPSPCQALRASCPARCTTPLAAALRTPQDCRRGSRALKVTLCSGARVPVSYSVSASWLKPGISFCLIPHLSYLHCTQDVALSPWQLHLAPPQVPVPACGSRLGPGPGPDGAAAREHGPAPAQPQAQAWPVAALPTPMQQQQQQQQQQQFGIQPGTFGSQGGSLLHPTVAALRGGTRGSAGGSHMTQPVQQASRGGAVAGSPPTGPPTRIKARTGQSRAAQSCAAAVCIVLGLCRAPSRLPAPFARTVAFLIALRFFCSMAAAAGRQFPGGWRHRD